MSRRRGVSAVSSMRLDGRDTHATHLGTTNQRPCQTLPKTNLARPPSISSARSILLLLPTHAGFKLCVSYKNASESPGQTFRSLRCARTALWLPSFCSFTHTVRLVRAYHAISSLHSHQGRAQRGLGSGGEICQRETKFPSAYISLGEGHEGSSSHTGVVTAGQRRGDRKMWPGWVRA